MSLGRRDLSNNQLSGKLTGGDIKNGSNLEYMYAIMQNSELNFFISYYKRGYELMGECVFVRVFVCILIQT